MLRVLTVVPLLLALAASSFAAPALAQEASPAAADARFADTMGLPELEIALTEEGLEGVPTETAVGRYLVTFTGDVPEASVNFTRLPEGVTVDDLLGAFPPATPASPDAPPPLAVPEWFYDTYFAGGGSAIDPGQSGRAVLDLRPGDYAVWNEDFESSVAVPLSVTGEMPADPAEPEADATIRESTTDEGYDFELTGTLTAGTNTIEVVNEADQPHHVVVVKSPSPLSEDQVMQLVMLDPESGATPPPGLPGFDKLTFPLYVPVQLAGSTQWHALNLEPGNYVLLCFVEDPTKENIPHSLEGMIETFEVAGA